MTRSLTIAAAGAVAGVVAAIAGIAMSAGLIIDGATGFVVVSTEQGTGRGTLTAGTDALYLYVLGFGLIGGAIVAFLAATLARTWNPEQPRFGALPIAAVGAVAGAITAYAILRAGIGLGGSITNEVVTISAFRGIATFLLAGATAGGVVAVTADRLSRPATLGLAGEAWPSTAAAFLKETMPAMLIPLLAVVLIAGAVVVLAQLLLAGGTVGSIVFASLISAAILGGAAFLVYRGDGSAAAD